MKFIVLLTLPLLLTACGKPTAEGSDAISAIASKIPASTPDDVITDSVSNGNTVARLEISIWRSKNKGPCIALIRSPDAADVTTWIKANGSAPRTGLARRVVETCEWRQAYLSAIVPSGEGTPARWELSAGPEAARPSSAYSVRVKLWRPDAAVLELSAQTL